MLVSFDPEFVFLEVPRTASRSMGDALRRMSRKYQQYNHHRMEILKAHQHFFVFACVRNPFAREYSHFRYRQTNPKNNMYQYVRDWSFEDYLHWSTNPDLEPVECHDHPQTQLLKNTNAHVIKYEELPAAFLNLPIVRSRVTLPHLNRSAPAREDWRKSYTDRLASRVIQWAQRDFDEFGYDLQSWRG